MRRVIDCPCGHRLEAANDDELFQAAQRHIAEHHPDMQRTDEQLRTTIRDRARDDALAQR